jgi:hypothetical protein
MHYCDQYYTFLWEGTRGEGESTGESEGKALCHHDKRFPAVIKGIHTPPLSWNKCGSIIFVIYK